MTDLKTINNNIIANRWKARYEKLPDEVKAKIDSLDNAELADYQLQVIKRKRAYPKIGDIFQINPRDQIFYYGIVINNHIKNINTEEQLLILIFQKDVNIQESIANGVKSEDLLLPPQIVTKGYWTRGYFYTIDHYEEDIHLDDYGFYDIFDRKFLDEYGNEIATEPKLLGTFGVCTISGIARKMNQEMIIDAII